MKRQTIKAVTYQVLIIEDAPGFYEDMQFFLEHWAKELEIQINHKLAKDSQTAQQLMSKQLFHSVAIDLRIPEKPGGPLFSEPRGIELVLKYSETRPLVWRHVFSSYAEDHALECYNKVTDKKLSTFPPIWGKASSDDEGPNRYTQQQWAQRVLAGLLPRSEAINVPIVQKRPELKQHLENHSPLGETMDFAFAAGRNHLPPGLAKSFAVIDRFLENGEPRHELKAFQEILFLAETVQHWLWVQAAAWLVAMHFPGKLRWPQTGNGQPGRAAVESALMSMCDAIAQSSQSSSAETWLQHLHYTGDSNELNIVDALRMIRELRNQNYHRRPPEELPWGEKQFIYPVRVILDACSYLAAYPILSLPRAAPDGRWRFTLLQGETDPLPEKEWSLTGMVGQKQVFDPVRDDQTLYQLWPGPDNTLGLLKLSPFAEQNVGLDGRKYWLLNSPDSRNPKRFFERSALDGQIQCTEISTQRLSDLKVLGVL